MPLFLTQDMGLKFLLSYTHTRIQGLFSHGKRLNSITVSLIIFVVFMLHNFFNHRSALTIFSPLFFFQVILAKVESTTAATGIPRDIFQSKEIVLFLKKSIKLCYLMQVQFPPMFLDFSIKPGDAMNLEKFNAYQKRGPKVAFVVWPPIYLHKDGPVVAKGYAEGAK